MGGLRQKWNLQREKRLSQLSFQNTLEKTLAVLCVCVCVWQIAIHGMSVCLSVVCVYKLTRSARIRSRVLLFLLCALFKRRRRRRPSSSAWLFSLTVLVGLFYKSKARWHMRRDTPGVSDGWKLVPRTAAAAVSSCYFINTIFLSWMKRRKMDTTRLQIDKKGKENLWLLLLVGISLRQEWVWCCFVYCYTPSSLDVTDSCFFHSYFHLFFFFFFLCLFHLFECCYLPFLFLRLYFITTILLHLFLFPPNSLGGQRG